MGGLIPYKNSKALLSYYMGLFAVLPVFGLILAVPALILGIKGLKFANSNPEARGKAHAWVGIIGGGLFTVLWGLTLVLIIVALVAGRNQ